MRAVDAHAIVDLELALQRTRMVREQLAARGITDDRVIAVFRAVPREEFVPAQFRDRAYDDSPLPIAGEQTISQPYIVALMAEAMSLRGDERVLDVGTGSGYAAAIFSRLSKEVIGVERIPELVHLASEVLVRIGYKNIHLFSGDGTLGMPEFAPYDAIAVSAFAPSVPQPLLDQLAPGGRLVIPIGNERAQTLTRVTRLSSVRFHVETMGDVRFVPLIGAPNGLQVAARVS